MDNVTMIEKVQRMTGEDDTDVVQDYLDIASELMLNRLYPFGYADGSEVPSRYGNLQVEVTVYLLNKRGGEGEISHSEGGVNRGYESAYVPESLLGRITPMASVIGGVSNETVET